MTCTYRNPLLRGFFYRRDIIYRLVATADFKVLVVVRIVPTQMNFYILINKKMRIPWKSIIVYRILVENIMQFMSLIVGQETQLMNLTQQELHPDFDTLQQEKFVTCISEKTIASKKSYRLIELKRQRECSLIKIPYTILTCQEN